MITDPITVSPDAPISDAMALMERYRISGVPVTVKRKTYRNTDQQGPEVRNKDQ